MCTHKMSLYLRVATAGLAVLSILVPAQGLSQCGNTSICDWMHANVNASFEVASSPVLTQHDYLLLHFDRAVFATAGSPWLQHLLHESLQSSVKNRLCGNESDPATNHAVAQQLLQDHTAFVAMRGVAQADNPKDDDQRLPPCLGVNQTVLAFNDEDSRYECICASGTCEQLVPETDSIVICMLLFVGAQMAAWSNSRQ